jgi:threonine dehydrogenase-like Zn-dependent dehydrogenase
MVMPAPETPLELREFRRPRLEPGAVLLETLASEVCGTDVHLWKGHLTGVPYPIIPGHVSVGRIAETTEEARDVAGRPLSVGQIVTFLDVYGTCGRCWYCAVAHATTRCPSRKVYGVTLSSEDGLSGGWSEHIHLRAGTQVLPLPEGLDRRAFMAGGCGMQTALHAVMLADIAFADTVVVQGAGPVGLCAAALARLRGAGEVIVIGGPPIRLEIAMRLGADAVIDIGTTARDNRITAILDRTDGRGADVTIEATGVPDAVPEGMRLTRDAGRYVVVGQYTNAGDTTFNPHLDLNQKHLEVRGCWGSDVSHLYAALRVMARHRLPWTELITREYRLEDAQRALEDVAAQSVVKALIVP